MTRVLLTGAGGFAGARTLGRILTDTDWQISATVSPRHGADARILRVLAGRPDFGVRVRIVRCDLSYPLAGMTVDRIGPVDLIVNLASDTMIDRSIVDPARIIRSNVLLMTNLLEYARTVCPETPFLHVGTDEEYGPIHGDAGPHREWDAILPANPYSGSKAAQSAIAITYWRTYGLPLILTRTQNLLGPGQPAVKFVPQVIARILAGQPVQVYASADGTPATRRWLDTWDLAGALIHIARHVPPAQHPAVDRPPLLHIAGTEYSTLDIAQAVARVLDRPLAVEYVDAQSGRPGHDLRYGLDGTLLESLGWKPERALEETLREIVAAYLAGSAR